MNCADDPPALLPDAEEILQDGLPDFVRSYKCKDGWFWQSGRRTRHSQCFNGKWTHILDLCLEECDDCPYPRDCTDVSRMGFNESDHFYISPTQQSSIKNIAFRTYVGVLIRLFNGGVNESTHSP
ncbi:uncharacterized protein [Palaemon carinicauda]|uniref:uncharacterized protein n=1 Tax=Palaemon carinicauda TaxID=392227 RepID=UPI0035B5A013